MRSSRKERVDDEKRSNTSKEQSRSTSRDKTSLTSAKRTAGSNEKICHACGAHFGLLHRKHDCRQCGNHFCSACSDNLILTAAGIPVRVCDACREKHDAKRQQEQANKKMSGEDEEDALIAKLVDESGEGSKMEWAKLPPGKERRMGRENELTQKAFSLLDDKWEGGSKLVAERKANGSAIDGSVDKKGTEGASQAVLLDPEGAKALRDAAQKLRADCVKFKEAGMSEAATKAFRKAKEMQRQADVLEHPPLPPSAPPAAKDDPKASKGQKEKKQAAEASSQGKAKKDEDEEVMKSLRELGWSDEKAKGKGGRVGQLEAQAKAHRRAALQFKKEGKRVEALEELRKAKVLDARAEEAELLGDDGDEDDLILGEVEADDEDAELRKLMEDHEREETSRARRGLGGKEDGGGGIDISILAALRDDDEDDDGDEEEVEVGDADLHDPVMNAMLKEMGWEQEGEGGQAVKAAKSELGAARLAGLKAAAVGFAETKAQLEEDIMAGKRKAGMLKREGKLQEAVVELRKAKAMEKELNEMETSPVAGAGRGEKQGGGVGSRQSLGGGSDRPLDMSAIHKLMAGGEEEEEEEEVEVTEDDEDDPDMKAALQAMGFVEEPPKPKAPKAAKGSVEVVGKAAENVRKEEPKVSPPFPAALAGSMGQGEGMRNWEGEAMVLKREAVALKRAGDLRGASEKLQQAKGLEKQAEEEKAMRVAMEGQQEEEEEEEEEVEVTEEDENDPDIMAAMSAMGWQEKEKEKEKGAEAVRGEKPSLFTSQVSQKLNVWREREALRNEGADISSRLDEAQTTRTAETASARQQPVMGAGGITREGYGGGGTRSRPPPVGEEAFWDGPSSSVVKDVPRGVEGPPKVNPGVVHEVKESFMDIRAALKTDGFSVGGTERVEGMVTGSSLQNRQEVKQKTEEASGSFGRAGGLGGDKEQSLGAGGNGGDGEIRLEGQAGPSLEDMSVEIMTHKRKALAFQREGKLQEARQELVVAKQLEGQVASRQASAQGGKEEGGGLGMAAVPPPPPPPPVSAPLTSSAPREAVREEGGVEKQILDLKRKAVALKREGRLEEAVQALKQAKALGIEQGQGGATRKEGDAVGAKTSMPVTAKPQAKAAPAVSRRAAPRPAVMLDDDDDELDEAKLDALLFGNLQSLGLMAGGSTKSAPASAPHPPPKTKAASASATTAPPPSSKAGGGAPLSATDRRKVEDQIKSFKVRAVQMKRGGNNTEALDALRSAKRLEAKLASLK